MDKATLRTSLLAARKLRSADDLVAARRLVTGHVLARAAAWGRVAAYDPLRTEPGSTELLDDLVAAGVEVLVPVVLPDRDLAWRAWAGGAALGVDAIASCDAVIVPALAVATADGTRLGRGGGSYDRALARVRPETPVIALLFDGELFACVPREPWDRPVTGVITPAGWTGVPNRG